MAVKKELSLLPDSENPRSLGARFLKWLTTTGRVTIVLTELVVISVFISRFWLDRKNSDLSELVRQKTAILQSTVAFENEYNQLQQKINYIKNSYADQPECSQQLSSLVSSTPQELFYKNISITQDPKTKGIAINTTLIAYKEESIVSFVSNLIANPDISQVDILKIEKKERENQYNLTLNLLFKPVTTKNKT